MLHACFEGHAHIRRMAEQATRIITSTMHCATSWPYLPTLPETNIAPPKTAITSSSKQTINLLPFKCFFIFREVTQGGIFMMWLWINSEAKHGISAWPPRVTGIFVKIGIAPNYHSVSYSTLIRRCAGLRQIQTNSQSPHAPRRPSLYFISKAQRCWSRLVSSVPGGCSTGFDLKGEPNSIGNFTISEN